MKIIVQVAAIVGLVLSVVPTAKAATDAVRLTDSLNGLPARAGQVVQVRVVAPSAASFVDVRLFSLMPGFGDSGNIAKRGMAYVFSIPRDAGFTTYTVSGVAKQQDGRAVVIQPIKIHTAPSEEVVAVRTELKKLKFYTVGGSIQMNSHARLSSGREVIFNSESALQCGIEDKAIARMSAGCNEVTSLGEGRTTGFIVYGGARTEFAISASRGKRGDFNGDKQIDMADEEELLSSVGAKPVSRLDSRDINGDGVIDMRDVEALRGLCDRPKCAQQ